MLKKNRSWIAFVLCVLLIIGCFPTGIVALESESTIISNLNDNSLLSETYEFETQTTEVVEIVSLREENVKHFRLPDGSYEAVVYPQAVHRKDKNGEWQNINNNLSLQNYGEVQKYITSDSRVKFSNSFRANSELVTLSENGYSISMTLLDEKGVLKGTSNDKSTKVTITNSSISQFKALSDDTLYNSLSVASRVNNRSTVLYSNVRANTDIEYELLGNVLKENIIVNSPNEDYTYRFQIKLAGLGAELSGDGTIILYDLQNGQMKYNIPAPYMYDNNGIYSTDVTYDLYLVNDGVYTFEVSADADWINADNRAFPVVIDPTISPDRVVYDTYTYSSYPDNNYGYDKDLWVSNYRTSYIKINSLPSLPSGASINNARMYVSYYYYVTSGSLVVSAHQVLGSWSETGLKYSNAPQVSSTTLSTATLAASSSVTESSPGNAYFTITNLVRNWYDGTSTNYGIALKRVSGDNQSVIIKSYEADGGHAYLSINYYPTASIANGIYQIKNAYTGQYMQVSGKATSAGTKIQQNKNTYEDHQHFLIKSVGNNEYTIQPIHAPSMAICTTSANSGTAVTLANYDSSNVNQRFSISVSDTGYYVIKNKKSDYTNALMVLNGSTTTEETVYQYAYNSNSLWHHWMLEFAGPESGVYAVKNSVNNTYMQSGATSTGYYVAYGTPSESPKKSGNRSGLFKITYRSNTQDYIIRNMADNAVLIYANTKYMAPLTLELLNTTDSNVPASNAWKITKAGTDSYYVWYQPSGGNKYYLTIPSSNHLSLTTDQATATKWEFPEYTSTQKGVDIKAKDSHIISAGTSIDLSSFASSTGYSYYSTTIGDNDPGNASFSVANISGTPTSVATISASGQLSANAQKCGVVRVTVAFSKGVSFSTNFYVSPSSGEFFFLQNIQSSGGIGIGYVDGNNSGATKNSLTYDATQLWQRIPSSFSGYYYIKNVGTGMYLSSPTSTSVGTAISMVSTVTSDLQSWEFTSTPSGAWKIRSRNDAVTGRNLYINIKSSSNNTIVQDTYIQNSSYLDEFNVIMIGNDVVYNRTLTWPTAIDPSNMMSDLSKYYDTYTLIQSDIYMDVPTARSLLENSKIMVFNGHGSPSVITIHEKPQSYIHNYEIFDPSNANNSLDLSGTDIVFFAGCSTGGNPCDYCDGKGKHEGHFADCPNNGSIYYNMPKSAQYAGAKVAIGWSVTTYDNHPNDWIERFIYYMNTINSNTNKLHTAYEAYIKTNGEITGGNANTAVIYGTDLDFRLSD